MRRSRDDRARGTWLQARRCRPRPTASGSRDIVVSDRRTGGRNDAHPLVLSAGGKTTIPGIRVRTAVAPGVQ